MYLLLMHLPFTVSFEPRHTIRLAGRVTANQYRIYRSDQLDPLATRKM